MSKKPLTRDEQFLAKTAGDDVPMPKPRTRAQEFLKRIVERLSGSVTEETLSNAIAPLNASIAQLSRKTIQFRHGKGTFTATANGTNITWQYGGQKAQGSNCTFDVKSDNGLICMGFDSIASLSIKNDTTNKMDLSDLGGKIANVLNLGYCSNITGVYSGTKYPKTFTVSKTSITAADMDANLINFAASGVKSGKFTAAGMKRTAASDNAVATLVTNGWTVSGLTKES